MTRGREREHEERRREEGTPETTVSKGLNRERESMRRTTGKQGNKKSYIISKERRRERDVRHDETAMYSVLLTIEYSNMYITL